MDAGPSPFDIQGWSEEGPHFLADKSRFVGCVATRVALKLASNGDMASSPGIGGLVSLEEQRVDDGDLMSTIDS